MQNKFGVMPLACLACATLLGLPRPSHAACTFASAAPLMCSSPSGAVIAFRNYGFDKELIGQSYTRQILKATACGSPFDPGHQQAKIQLHKEYRVAMPNGWETVSLLTVGAKYTGYVDNHYIKGTCDRFVPEVAVGKTDY